ncbi:MAG: hypothetical protein JWN95_3145 [Frankiales bacterium]|nr:hypothetical protein [Frankiales bacterium]
MNTGPFARRRPFGGGGGEAALITRLRGLPENLRGPRPSDQFRSELRTQLAAIAVRVVEESDPQPSKQVRTAVTTDATDSAPSGTGAGRGRHSGPRRHRVLRPVLALASAATVLILLLGLAVFLSHGSVPGDPLYGFKRAGENFHLTFAGGQVDKGTTYLQYATKRASEAVTLTDKSGDDNDLEDALKSTDSDTRNGMQLLGKATLSQSSTSPLSILTPWIPAQRAVLEKLLTQAPAGDGKSRVTQSLALLARAQSREAQWRTGINCACLALASTDDLGPVLGPPPK